MPPLTLALGQLGTADWLVLGAYFAALVGLGAWASRRGATSTADYFLASRSMPVWAVAFSILSTAQSAATYVGVPAASYGGNLTYLSSSIGGVVAAIILARVVIPAYYRLGVGTPYELLTARFGSTGRIAAASAYLIGRVFASGARVFVAAIPAAVVLFGEDAGRGHQAVLIAMFTALGIALCYVGGVRSVIWIDVLQVCVYLGAAIATICAIAWHINIPAGQVVDALRSGAPGGASKLTLISLSASPAATFTLWTALTGFVLLTLASHGADQDLVQRMLTCKDSTRGAWSVISGVLIGIPAVLIFLVLGLLLWWFYFARAGVEPKVAPAGDVAFQVFALNHMSGWGGAGLVIAGLFACGPAGINSGLSAMASSFVSDVYRPLRTRRHPSAACVACGHDRAGIPVRSPCPECGLTPDAARARVDQHELRVGHAATVGAGLSLGGMALACTLWYDPANRTILDFVLAVMTFAYAGLLGVFGTALFTRRGNPASCVAALIVGALTQVAFQPPIWNPISAWAVGALGMGPADGSAPAPVALAFPWQLVVGAGVAFVVCWVGRPRVGPTGG